ncbi:MAG: hypothetical protein AB1410_11410 [Acidobacteriota bacterium]
MKKILTIFCLSIIFISPSIAQIVKTTPAEKITAGFEFTIGTTFEYFIQKIKFKENEFETTVSSPLIYLSAGIAPFENFYIHITGGYTPPTFKESPEFMELPFSLQFEKNKLSFSGMSYGTKLEYKNFFETQDFGISAFLSYLYHSSSRKDWEITSLPIVTGKATGKNNWNKFQGGVIIDYFYTDNVTPYFGLYANYLSGKIDMEEKIEELSGIQTLNYKGKSIFGVLIGSDFAVNENFIIKGEVRFLSEMTIYLSLNYYF